MIRNILPALILLLAMGYAMSLQAQENPRVLFKTTLGDIELELAPDKAPVGTENFLAYVRSGFYDNTLFHRVIPGFVIQGGGFDGNGEQKKTRDPIVNEAGNGLKNLRGTICWARTNVINSATSQFFINHRDNPSLDHRDNTQAGFGYAVFGKVVKGMDVVDKIASVKTGQKELTVLYQGQKIKNPMDDVPVKPVLILTAKEAKPAQGK
jgi:peptidyl-prolyl cis-trans isomerase A (cyclophilin A)